MKKEDLTQDKPESNCMEFNKGKWHYKVVTSVFGKYHFSRRKYVHGNWVEKNYDTSICEYFWTIVLCSLIFPFKYTWDHLLPDLITEHDTLCKAVLIWAVVSAVLHFYIPHAVGITEVDVWYFGLAVFFAGIGISLGFIGMMALVFKINDVVDNYHKKKVERKEGKPIKPSRPSLLVEFLKAKKNKVCPCIRFVDEKEEDEKNEST